eukprot:scaffold7655_cov417-Prasinococcus_capsulatus_cf.AAC.4
MHCGGIEANFGARRCGAKPIRVGLQYDAGHSTDLRPRVTVPNHRPGLHARMPSEQLQGVRVLDGEKYRRFLDLQAGD